MCLGDHAPLDPTDGPHGRPMQEFDHRRALVLVGRRSVLPATTSTHWDNQPRSGSCTDRPAPSGRTGALRPTDAWDARPTGTADYLTRLVVVRPIDPIRFDGTVLLEWLNVSYGAGHRGRAARTPIAI